MSGLLRALPAEPAPDLLRARIERELRTIAGRPRERVRRLRWSAMAASLIVALGIGWLGGSLLGQGGARDRRAGRGLSARGHERARRRCRLVRPPHGQAVVRRPHRLFAAGARSHGRRAFRCSAAGSMSSTAARWPCWSIAATSTASPSTPVACVVDRQHDAASVGSATASRLAEWRHAASRCGPSPTWRRPR